MAQIISQAAQAIRIADDARNVVRGRDLNLRITPRAPEAGPPLRRSSKEPAPSAATVADLEFRVAQPGQRDPTLATLSRPFNSPANKHRFTPVSPLFFQHFAHNRLQTGGERKILDQVAGRTNEIAQMQKQLAL